MDVIGNTADRTATETHSYSTFKVHLFIFIYSVIIRLTDSLSDFLGHTFHLLSFSVKRSM